MFQKGSWVLGLGIPTETAESEVLLVTVPFGIAAPKLEWSDQAVQRAFLYCFVFQSFLDSQEPDL